MTNKIIVFPLFVVSLLQVFDSKKYSHKDHKMPVVHQSWHDSLRGPVRPSLHHVPVSLFSKQPSSFCLIHFGGTSGAAQGQKMTFDERRPSMEDDH